MMGTKKLSTIREEILGRLASNAGGLQPVEGTMNCKQALFSAALLASFAIAVPNVSARVSFLSAPSRIA